MAVYLTASEVAEHFCVDSKKVSTWIANGDLAAIDVSAEQAKRPRWRIHRDEVERFELERRSIPKPKPTRRRSRAAVQGIPKYV